MEELKLLVQMHSNQERQGPGSRRTTEQALELAGLNQAKGLNIADIGCGTGAATLVLAGLPSARITAIDIFPEFLSILGERARKEDLSSRIVPTEASMDQLPFQPEEFDVIWSEGAIYNMGFRNGLNQWRPYLKKSGIIAVSEITWLTPTRPGEIQEFWDSQYPEMGTASEKIAIMEEAGYKILGYFPLPESGWLDNYYRPLEDRFPAFLDEQNQSEAAKTLVENERQEIELYRKYSATYSYGFYIGMKLP